MSFGPIMKLKTDAGLQLELAPFSREECASFVDAFQRWTFLRYTGNTVETIATEQEWYDGMVKRKNDLVWGIWVIDNSERKLIGSTAINDIGPHVASQRNMTQGTTGISITDLDYWGKGVASAAHKARTWYAFRQHGIVRLKSAVAQENVGSRKALERSGYFYLFTERNFQFVNGHNVHEDNLECLNPDDWAWRLWWGDDRPTRKAVEARQQTLEALGWAEEHVELL